MPPTLPSARRRESAIAAIASLALGSAVAACGPGPAPVAPGPPIPAEPDLAVDTMAVECGALVTSLETWKQCKNLEEEERDYIVAWIERGIKPEGEDVLTDRARHHGLRRGHQGEPG